MSEVFLGINKTGELYVDATLDASITIKLKKYISLSFLNYFKKKKEVFVT